MSSDLHTKYRPKAWDEVLGQESVVTSLRGVLKKKTCRAFIFEGPTGTGKTTLARLVALKIGCDPKNIVEVDAATNSGVDAMRDVTASMIFNAIGDSPKKMYIIDEAHQLSKQAWTSLLKSVEEPPPHVYWAFCTTEAVKIPEALWKGRCNRFALRPVPVDDIFTLLTQVAKAEELDTPDEVIDFLAIKAEGSPRFGITLLGQFSWCKTRKEAVEATKSVEAGSAEIVEVCRELLKGTSWTRMMKVLKKMEGANPESIRILVCNWFTKVAMDAGDEKRAGRALDILESFSTPYPAGNTSMYPLLISLGKILVQ
jgi:DNA polymerase III gamma/tau subunit